MSESRVIKAVEMLVSYLKILHLYIWEITGRNHTKSQSWSRVETMPALQSNVRTLLLSQVGRLLLLHERQSELWLGNLLDNHWLTMSWVLWKWVLKARM